MMLNQVKSKLDCVSKHRFIATFMTTQHGVPRMQFSNEPENKCRHKAISDRLNPMILGNFSTSTLISLCSQVRAEMHSWSSEYSVLFTLLRLQVRNPLDLYK